MDKWLTLHEAVKSCDCIPEESKTLFTQGLHSAIDLYESELRNEKLLNDRYGISAEDDRGKAKTLCDKLNDGIKAAKKLKTIVANIDRGNSVLINALNEFVENAERNLEIEKPTPLTRGGQVNEKMHALGLSFKSAWERHSEVEIENPGAIKIATLFFIEAGIYPKPNDALENNEIRNKVEKLFKRQLSGKSKITPYLQVVKTNKQKSRD